MKNKVDFKTFVIGLILVVFYFIIVLKINLSYLVLNNKPSVIYINPQQLITPIENLEPRYGFTDEEIYLLAQLLCGGKDIDGDGEYDIDFQTEINYYEVGKVLCIVMNRVWSKDFPNTVKDVVLQKGQFSVIPRNLNREPSDKTLQIIKDWCRAYDRYDYHIQVIPTNHLYFNGNGVINITRANYN